MSPESKKAEPFILTEGICKGICLDLAGVLYIIAGIRKEKALTVAQLTGGPRVE